MTSDRLTDVAVMSALSIELGPLRALAEWEPVGAFFADFTQALRDGEGLDRRQVDRMRKWCRRWLTLDPKLRAFYADELNTHDPHGVVESAMYRVLDADHGRALTSRQTGILVSVWRDRYGHDPALDLAPLTRPGGPQ